MNLDKNPDNIITGERKSLADLMTEAGLRGHDHLPSKLVPPAAVVMSGGPYLEAGETFGSWTLRFDVLVVTDNRGTNDVVTGQLDVMLMTALTAMHESGWVVESIDEPRMLGIQNASYLHTTITVSTTITL